MGGPARRYSLAAGAVAVGAPGIFCGFTVRETAGSAAAVRIHDGASATGAILATIGLAANASATELGAGVSYTTGVFVEIVSGTVEGSVFVA